MQRRFSCCLIVAFLLSSLSFALEASDEAVVQRFFDIQRKIRRHRAEMLPKLNRLENPSESKIFGVETGTRIFFRWAERPLVDLKSVKMRLESDRSSAEGLELAIVRELGWGYHWYSTWLPFESRDVSILKVEAFVEKQSLLNPFQSRKLLERYESQIPVHNLVGDHPKFLLMSLEVESPFTQKLSGQAELKLSVHSGGEGVDAQAR